jgi:hypothetical protein
MQPGPFDVIATHAPNALFTPTIGPNSTAPVATDKPDLEFDTDVPFRKGKSSRAKWVVAMVGLAGLGVAGFGGTQGWFARPSAAAALELPPLPTETPVAMQAPPAPAAEPAPATPAAAPSANPHGLTDDKRKALLDADKARSAKSRARQRVTQQAPAQRGRPGKPSTPFHKGGEVGDPLNSSL